MLKGEYVVVKLPVDFQISDQILKFDFYNLTRTSDAVSYTHLPSPRDATLSRMPSSA